MSQSFWEPQVVEEETQLKSAEPAASLVVSVDEFAALEERILRAIHLVKQERQARIAAEAVAAQAQVDAVEAQARAEQAEADLRDKTPVMESLEAEIKTLKGERDHVRDRVERLLQQLDALEL
jgi:hypothetical protein